MLQMCTVGHKSHDPCFHKKYMEAGVMTFVSLYLNNCKSKVRKAFLTSVGGRLGEECKKCCHYLIAEGP